VRVGGRISPRLKTRRERRPALGVTADAGHPECVACIPLHANTHLLNCPDLYKAYTGHLGGVSLGFLDGHAASMHPQMVLVRYKEGKLQALDSWGPNSECGFHDWADPGVPILYQIASGYQDSQRA
jgi:prepilin-type processing-associated H-X9-DG protein